MIRVIQFCLLSIVLNSAVFAADHIAKIPAPPTIDRSAPESVLRSYWEYLDWKEQVREGYLQSTEYRIDTELRKEIMGGERFAFQNWSDVDYKRKKYSRTILSIKQLSDKSCEIRVRIKNVTPIPADVNLMAISRLEKLLFSRKSMGDEIRYVAEKFADGWKITEVLVTSAFEGESSAWTPAYSIPAVAPYVVTVSP